MDVSSHEFTFATDLMSRVLRLYGIEWMSEEINSNNGDSPFTDVVKKSVDYIWNEKKEFISDLFYTVERMGTVNALNYEVPMKFACHLVTAAEYDEIELLRHCVITSGFAAHFYMNGLMDAPNRGVRFIYDTIMSFRTKSEFTDESWSDIELLGKAYSAEPCKKASFSSPTSAFFNRPVDCEASTSNYLPGKVCSRNIAESKPMPKENITEFNKAPRRGVVMKNVLYRKGYKSTIESKQDTEIMCGKDETMKVTHTKRTSTKVADSNIIAQKVAGSKDTLKEGTEDENPNRRGKRVHENVESDIKLTDGELPVSKVAGVKPRVRKVLQKTVTFKIPKEKPKIRRDKKNIKKVEIVTLAKTVADGNIPRNEKLELAVSNFPVPKKKVLKSNISKINVVSKKIQINFNADKIRKRKASENKDPVQNSSKESDVKKALPKSPKRDSIAKNQHNRHRTC